MKGSFRRQTRGRQFGRPDCRNGIIRVLGFGIALLALLPRLPTMLFAQFQPKNDAEALGFAVGTVVGTVVSAAISGGIPLITGLLMRRSQIGIIGGVISAVLGALSCCLGLPAGIMFAIVIGCMGMGNAPASREPPWADDYDDYARPFQLPPGGGDQGRRAPRRDDREREADADWRRRAANERDHERGFRPRQRPDDQGR